MMRGNYFRYFAQFIKPLPIRIIDFNNKTDIELHNRMVHCVERLINLYGKNKNSINVNEKEMLEHQIKRLNREIDMITYELYGLTEEEVRVIEEGNR